MDKHVRFPDPLPDKKPMDKTWKMWREEFNIFLRAAGYHKNASDEKAFTLMNAMGKVGLEAMQNIEFESDEDKNDFDILLSKLDEYFDPPKRETEERFKFYTRSKKNNEAIEDYIADLKEKAKTCNFGDLSESLVRDMVILDIKDKTLRQMMFQEKKLDLNKIIFMYKQYELSTEKMKEVTKKVSAENAESKSKDSATPTEQRICWRCGISHQVRACPAFKVTCDKCNERGHFTQRCKNKNSGKNAGKSSNNDNSDQSVSH